MNKKKTTIVKLMVSLVLALVLSLGAATPAFATVGVSSGSEDADAPAAVTKRFTVPEGTATPAESFNFLVIPKGIDLAGNDVGSMPTFGSTTISFTPDDIATSDGANTGSQTAVKQSDNIFAASKRTGTWPYAGVYLYTVKEEKEEGSGKPGYAYAQAEYEFRVYVANKGVNELYVAAISAAIAVTEHGTVSTDLKGKVDPTPGDGSEQYPFSAAVFKNSFKKSIDGTDPTDLSQHVLQISKKVVGPYANRTKYFPFELRVNAPGHTEFAPIYKAYIIEKIGNAINWTVVSQTDYAKNYKGDKLTNTDSSYGYYIPVVANFADFNKLDFYLKHNQMLVFVKMDVGATCRAIEKMETGNLYKASVNWVTVDSNGSKISGYSPPLDSLNSPHSAPDLIISDELKDDSGKRIPSRADYTNELPEATPGGISADNLPFVMLVVFALVALAGYVVFRTRRTAAKAGK